MVAANRSATYIRELDVFGNKLGINRGSSVYEVASENELRWNLNKFLLELEAFSQPKEVSHVSERVVVQ